MSEKKQEKFIPDEDYEYERQLALEEQQRREAAEEAARKRAEERRRKQREEQALREKRLAQEKLELMKLKAGVIEESETIKEEHTEAVELHGAKRLENFWYHNKMWIIFAMFIIGVTAFIVHDMVTRVKPDLIVMMIADNGLAARQEELEQFFEKYTDDLNGDGEVHVTVMMMPLNSNDTDQMQAGYQAKFLAQLQNADSMMIIMDSNTNEDFREMVKHDLAEDFPDNPYIDEYGLSLNFKLLADELNYEFMPYDVHLALRKPEEMMSASLEEMQESYDKYFVVFKRITDDLTRRAQEADDPGLETEPVSNNS